jgi:hypothetical protein
MFVIGFDLESKYWTCLVTKMNKEKAVRYFKDTFVFVENPFY